MTALGCVLIALIALGLLAGSLLLVCVASLVRLERYREEARRSQGFIRSDRDNVYHRDRGEEY